MEALKRNPTSISAWRMSTAPPIARDRLVGLAGIRPAVVKALEAGRLPARGTPAELSYELESICEVINSMLDRDLFSWVVSGMPASPIERTVAATVVADRLCGAVADPIVRNAQERRQLAVIGAWLNSRGYVKQIHPTADAIRAMTPGTYSFRQNVIVRTPKSVNMPIDVVVQPHGNSGKMPVLIEAKSAGDFTNTNKRRKEEATKVRQLRHSHGDEAGLLLFLNGYFDSGHLGYEAAEGLDWVWEHRVEDLADAGI